MATQKVPTLDGSGKLREKHLPSNLGAAAMAATYAAASDLTRVPTNRALVRGYSPALTLYGNTSVGLRKWRDALNKAADGTRLAKIGCYGDSTTEGYGASPAMYSAAYPARLQTILNNTVGGGGEGFLHWWNTDDPRSVWSAPAPVAITGYGPFGQSCRKINSATTGHDSYHQFGAVTCDTFRVYCIAQATPGTFHYKIDAGAWVAATIPARTNGLTNQAVGVDVPAGSVGSHTITVSSDQGASWYYLGLGYRTGTKGVIVSRMGLGGSKPDMLVGSVGDGAGSLESAFDAYAPDLSIILFGHNNVRDQTPIASFKADMQTIISRAKQTGDVLLVTTIPRQDGATFALKPIDYDKAVYELADANNVPVLDLSARWHSDWPWANGQAFMVDGVHPNNAGYQQMAQAVANVIL